MHTHPSMSIYVYTCLNLLCQRPMQFVCGQEPFCVKGLGYCDLLLLPSIRGSLKDDVGASDACVLGDFLKPLCTPQGLGLCGIEQDTK